MKHKLCVISTIIVLLSASLQIAAQLTQSTYQTKWFSIGAKAGYNIALSQDKISEDLYAIHTGLRHGGSMGFYMRIGTNIFCQPEVTYSFSLYDANRNIAGNKLKQSLQTHTIDLPVLLGYSAICSETFKLKILLGPRFAFDVHKDPKFDAVPTENYYITASMSQTRLGVDLGIGFDLWRISLDLRYVLMQDIYKYQYLDETTSEWKKVLFPISMFHIAIGYNIWGNNIPNKNKLKYDPNAYDFFRYK